MNRRQIKKVVKTYGDTWWKQMGECSWYLSPPGSWNCKKVLDEFHRQHWRGQEGQFVYALRLPEPITNLIWEGKP